MIFIITYYGYSDGSGEYYVVIDSIKCTGCGKCLETCPQSALEIVTQFIDLEDKTVVAVNEKNRKKIKYTCSRCLYEGNTAPCSKACEENAISTIWKTS
ncbi:4Fe-4S dicluster domain-containing protein [Candidatus Bathyarchaeota archaeon]|nr:4Fe-4S dicluster domain-containing protein [Candidatus Bathyarchaeota archaeon]